MYNLNNLNISNRPKFRRFTAITKMAPLHHTIPAPPALSLACLRPVYCWSMWSRPLVFSTQFFIRIFFLVQTLYHSYICLRTWNRSLRHFFFWGGGRGCVQTYDESNKHDQLHASVFLRFFWTNFLFWTKWQIVPNLTWHYSCGDFCFFLWSHCFASQSIVNGVSDLFR